MKRGAFKIMTRKSAILIIIILYFLTPFSIKIMNSSCQCGYREFTCYCCKNQQNFCGVTSFSECQCPIDDESYAQPPAVVEYPTQTLPILGSTGFLMSGNNGLILPGYQQPPMKPPPSGWKQGPAIKQPVANRFSNNWIFIPGKKKIWKNCFFLLSSSECAF